MEWYQLKNIDLYDTPSLVLYKDRIEQNISHAIGMVSSVGNLRPHVKTNKIAEVCRMMMHAGIYKFKCATIAEAEMLAIGGAVNVLLAYQPVSIKIERFKDLVIKYPGTFFSCFIDDEHNAASINKVFAAAGITANVFIDVNVGMNRTGIKPGAAFDLFQYCLALNNIRVIGLHGYDGQVTDTDLNQRRQQSDDSFGQVIALAEKIKATGNIDCVLVGGGSPTFPVYAKRSHIECSPGTFVFWDWGYAQKYPEEPFSFAALVITRVISVVDEQTICVDLGHKAIAAEMPFPRVHFLNAPAAAAVSQSEEHLVLKVDDSSVYRPGDVLYGVPVHICPTVALHEYALVAEHNLVTESWQVIARKRSITI